MTNAANQQRDRFGERLTKATVDAFEELGGKRSASDEISAALDRLAEFVAHERAQLEGALTPLDSGAPPSLTHGTNDPGS